MRKARGFTLIEVMIVITILAILAAIAYPSYTRYMQRSYRSDAQQFMVKMDSRQKQLLIEQRAYAATPDLLNVGSQGWTCSAASCINGKYTITFNPAVNNAATPPSYTVCAVPGANQATDGTLSLTSDGTKRRFTAGTCVAPGGTELGW